MKGWIKDELVRKKMDEIIFGIKSSLTITVRSPRYCPNEFLTTRRATYVHGELNKKRGRTAKEKPPSCDHHAMLRCSFGTMRLPVIAELFDRKHADQTHLGTIGSNDRHSRAADVSSAHAANVKIEPVTHFGFGGDG
jgi:hypothetical protein